MSSSVPLKPGWKGEAFQEAASVWERLETLDDGCVKVHVRVAKKASVTKAQVISVCFSI